MPPVCSSSLVNLHRKGGDARGLSGVGFLGPRQKQGCKGLRLLLGGLGISLQLFFLQLPVSPAAKQAIEAG